MRVSTLLFDRANLEEIEGESHAGTDDYRLQARRDFVREKLRARLQDEDMQVVVVVVVNVVVVAVVVVVLLRGDIRQLLASTHFDPFEAPWAA